MWAGRSVVMGRPSCAGWQRVQRMLTQGKGLPLLFPRHDLGFQYAASRNGSRGTTTGATAGGATSATADQTYGLQLVQLGCRLPHCWLKRVGVDGADSANGADGEEGCAGAQQLLSTLDVLAEEQRENMRASGRVLFVTGASASAVSSNGGSVEGTERELGEQAAAWLHAQGCEGATCAEALRVVRITTAGLVVSAYALRGVLGAPVQPGYLAPVFCFCVSAHLLLRLCLPEDLHSTATNSWVDSGRQWEDVLTASGLRGAAAAVLVRPDGVVRVAVRSGGRGLGALAVARWLSFANGSLPCICAQSLS